MHQLHCKGSNWDFFYNLDGTLSVLAAPAGGSNKRGHFLLFFLFWIVSETHNWKEWIQNSKAGPCGIPSHDSCMRSCLRKYPWVVQSWLVLVSREYLLNTNTEELDSIHIKVTESVSPSIICIAMNWRYYISLFTCYF